MNSVFAEGSFWRPLQCDEEAVKEPDNPLFDHPHEPTIPAKDRDYIPIKHNFSQRIEREAFTGVYDAPQRFSNGTVKKNRDGTPQTKSEYRRTG